MGENKAGNSAGGFSFPSRKFSRWIFISKQEIQKVDFYFQAGNPAGGFFFLLYIFFFCKEFLYLFSYFLYYIEKIGLFKIIGVSYRYSTRQGNLD